MSLHLAPLLALALACAPGWAAPAMGWTASGEGSTSASATASQATAAGAGQTGGTAAVKAPPLQPPAQEPAPGNPVAEITTSHGVITIELFKDRAPVSTENFVQYASENFYDGTIFHRVVPNFMIQGGGYLPSMAEKPTRAPIQNEATNGLRNTRGTVAMARKQALRSATAQFYINVADNRMLDHAGYAPSEFGYAVFGRVLSGMDVVDRIANMRTTATPDGMENVPVEPVSITSVRIRGR